MIRQSNHWKKEKKPLYFAFCGSSNEFVSVLGIQSLHAQERASENFLCIRFDCTQIIQIHHFVDYVMSRFGRQGSAFVTDDFDLHCSVKTLTFGTRPSPQVRLSGSRISLVSRLRNSHTRS